MAREMNRTAMMIPACLLLATGSAFGYVNTMYDPGFEPSLIGTQIAGLDIANTSYDFNAPGNLGSNTQSAFTRDIDLGGGNFLTVAETSLVSRVFQVQTPTLLTDPSGDLQLDQGDLVFEYTLNLVGRTAGETDVLLTLQEFDISALSPNPLFPSYTSNIFDSSIVKGRGFSVAGLANGTAQDPDAGANDFQTQGLPGGDPFLSQLAWQFDGGQPLEMLNGTSIRFLMFTKPALVEEGRSSLTASPGQVSSDTATVANSVPVLVPVLPAPGAGMLAVLAGVVCGTRRRR